MHTARATARPVTSRLMTAPPNVHLAGRKPNGPMTGGIDRLMLCFAWASLVSAALFCPIAYAIAWPDLSNGVRLLVGVAVATGAAARLGWYNPVRHVRSGVDGQGSWWAYSISAALSLLLSLAHPIFLLTVMSEYITCFVWADYPKRCLRMSAIHSAVVLAALLRWALPDGDWLLLGLGSVTAFGASFSSVLIVELRYYLDERQRLIASLDASRADLSIVQHEAGVLKERQRISRDIHDTVAQDLVGVIRWLEHAEHTFATDATHAQRVEVTVGSLGKATELARSALAETRTIVAAQPPPALAESGFGHALSDLIRRASTDADYHIDLTVSGPTRELSIHTTTALLRITQEGLNNVRRHAHARAVSIDLCFHDDRVVVEVSDDGVGLPGGHAAGTTGHGLHWMRSRVGELGGSLSIGNGPVSGTIVRAEVPA